MGAPPRNPLTGRAQTTLYGGLLGGLLGTSGMIFIGVAAERGAGLPLPRLLPELELGFGGPAAGAGVLGADFSLPIHYLHGAVLGILFAGLLLLSDHLGMAPRVPLWSIGLIFGAVVSGFVLALLKVTSAGVLDPGLIGLVCLLHLTFGGSAGAVIQRVRAMPLPATPASVPR